MNALLLIDIQNDFLAGGALEVTYGNEVIPIANSMIERFNSVFATQDWHPPEHGSFASQHPEGVFEVVDLYGLPQILWPDHCVQHSFGAELHKDLNTTAIESIIQKGTDPTVDSYSGFVDKDERIETSLHQQLQHAGIRTLYICGLATDFCVKFTVLDAIKRGYDVWVIVDGCRGVNKHIHDSQRAIQEMETAGAKIIASVDVPNHKEIQ